MSGDGNARVNKAVSVMIVNFICQLDLAERGLNHWPNSISGVSMRMTSAEIGTWISRLSKDE